MNENAPTSVTWDDNPNGTVTFATDVVATIAGLAATEVEGVASMSSSSGGGFADILTRRSQAARGLTRGVKIEVSENKVLVDVSIIVEYGTPIPDIASSIQENVKKAIETMSGLTVLNVDVHVQGVSFEREQKANAELEMKQQKLLDKEPTPEAKREEAPVEEEEEEEETASDEYFPEEFPDAPDPAPKEDIEVEVADDTDKEESI